METSTAKIVGFLAPTEVAVLFNISLNLAFWLLLNV